MSDPKLPAWVEAYIEIPFQEKGRDHAGCDCWGLARLIWREQFGLDVPSYAEDYRTTTDAEEIGALVKGHPDRRFWQPIPLRLARPGDALSIRMLGQEMHIAIIVAAPWFLHIAEEMEPAVLLERYDSIMWAKRVLPQPHPCAYRHIHLEQAVRA